MVPRREGKRCLAGCWVPRRKVISEYAVAERAAAGAPPRRTSGETSSRAVVQRRDVRQKRHCCFSSAGQFTRSEGSTPFGSRRIGTRPDGIRVATIRTELTGYHASIAQRSRKHVGKMHESQPARKSTPSCISSTGCDPEDGSESCRREFSRARWKRVEKGRVTIRRARTVCASG